jgi:hypothetical protein
MAVMLLVVFATRLSALPPFAALAPLGHVAWPWYVPIGTLLTVGAGTLMSLLPHGDRA